jgi:KDZ transposase-like protein
VNCKSLFIYSSLSIDQWCRAKYPLAVVETLLEVFGIRTGGGYDIGCKFRTTLDLSELGPLARQLDYKALVGSFHGHAHNRLCQLTHLATYVRGMGLEDLEGCERFFSKSNALASSLRYASVFHRQQKIVEFMKHTDAFETSQNLSTLFFCIIPTALLLKLYRRISC